MNIRLSKTTPTGIFVFYRGYKIKDLLGWRDTDWLDADRNYCVYIWRTPKGEVAYIGKGRFTNWDDITDSRALKHLRDLLSTLITSEWTCEIVCFGITDKEAKALEANLIEECEKELTKRGSKVWIEGTLVNKRHERKNLLINAA